MSTDINILLKSLETQRETGDRQGEGTTLNNISNIYQAQGDYDTALDYLHKSLEIQREIEDKVGMCATLFNMGHIHLNKEDEQQAVAYWVGVYAIAKGINDAEALSALEDLAKELGCKGLTIWESLAQQVSE
ncbi:MAG: tetratricopeptide repeat protein [Pseudomonadota bacterium]